MKTQGNEGLQQAGGRRKVGSLNSGTSAEKWVANSFRADELDLLGTRGKFRCALEKMVEDAEDLIALGQELMPGRWWVENFHDEPTGDRTVARPDEG